MDTSLALLRPRLLEAAGMVVLVIVVVYLGLRAMHFIPDTYQRIEHHSFLVRLDYQVFDGAADVIRDGHGDLLYQPRELQNIYHTAVYGPSGPYVFPPVLAFFWIPLSALRAGLGYGVYTAVSIAMLAGLGLTSLRYTRDIGQVALTILAIASYRPVHVALLVGQPSIPMAAAIAVALMSFQASRWWATGGFLALLVVKPQFLVTKTILLFRKRFPLRGWLFYGGCLSVLGLAPFLILGIGAVGDFVRMIRDQSDYDFKLRGGGAGLLYSWQGFLALLTRQDVKLWQLLPLIVITTGATLIAIDGGDFAVAALASILGGLLIFHSLIYDWVMVIPAAIMVAFRPAPSATRYPTLGLVFLLHFVSSGGYLTAFGRYPPQFWTPLVGMLLLLWLATLPSIEGRLREDRGEDRAEAVPAPA
jgi:hypothetical protein